MSSPVKALWRRIETMLTECAPEVLESLARPAKPAQVLKLESEFGEPLPDALKASWAIHDGQDVDGWDNCLFADFPFYGVAEVRKARKQMRDVAKSLGSLDDSDDFDAWHSMVADGVGVVDGPVKARDFNSKWLPIGSLNGDVFRFLDFDPAPGGTIGQVIEVDPESVSWRVLSPSFEKFLERYVDALEAGHINWDDPECGSSALFPEPKRKRMPEYLKANAPKKMTSKERAGSPEALHALAPGQSLSLQVEVSRIIGYSGHLDARLDLPNGENVWVTATTGSTRGYKQITMRSRGVAELQRLPGKKAQYVLAAFSRRK